MELIHTVFEPQGAGPHPTIVALHGWGANALDLLGLAPHICQGRFLVLCPQGFVQVPIGQGVVGYGWYPLTGGGAPDMAAVETAQRRLEAFVEIASNRYPMDPNKLVLLGFSQGGVMTYRLGLQSPQRFTAMAALSTWLPSAFLDDRPTSQLHPPLLIQHGSQDDLVGIDKARQSVEALRPLGGSVTYREYDMRHEINAHSIADLSTWLQEKVVSSRITAM